MIDTHCLVGFVNLIEGKSAFFGSELEIKETTCHRQTKHIDSSDFFAFPFEKKQQTKCQFHYAHFDARMIPIYRYWVADEIIESR